MQTINPPNQTSPVVIENGSFSLTIKKWDPFTRRLAEQTSQWLQGFVQEDYPTESLRQSQLERAKEPELNNEHTPFLRDEKGQFSGLLTEDQIYNSLGRIPLYKPVVNYIHENVNDEFNSRQVAEIIGDFWELHFNRTVSKASLRTYASAYLTLMDKLGFIQKVDKRGRCKKKERKQDDPNSIAEMIYSYAQKANLVAQGSPIHLDYLSSKLDMYTSEDLKRGLAKLVSKGYVTQLSPQRIKFSGQ